MKKLFAILLAVTMLASMVTVASAAQSTTTLTTTVPAATYTMNIPANQEIPFGATETDIGAITVTDATGFAVDKNLKVTINYDAFSSATTSTEIPFAIKFFGTYQTAANRSDAEQQQASGSSFVFLGQEDGTVKKFTEAKVNSYTCQFTKTLLLVESEAWGKALAGEYTTTITFTTEVVVEQ